MTVAADGFGNPAKAFCFLFIYSNISDSKRQQTTTVDYKRLFNGFVLTKGISLRYNKQKNKNMAKKDTETKLEITICDIKGINSINIESLIRVIRGQQVMLDSDLAMLYGVETRTLNQAVKRNIKRFLEDFMFQLTQD